jgi:hypothetical protein
VRDADYIYTDLWWWVGQEDEIPERRAAFMPKYQVNMDLLRQAPAHCKFMHCLPASRGVEATDEVMDSPQSIIFDQCREPPAHREGHPDLAGLHPRLKRPSPELLAFTHRPDPQLPRRAVLILRRTSFVSSPRSKDYVCSSCNPKKVVSKRPSASSI